MIVLRTNIDGKPVLALSTGLSEYAASKSRLQRGGVEGGYRITSDGGIHPWMPEGTFTQNVSEDMRLNHSGILHIYGPDFDGTSLLEILQNSDPETAWKKIHTVLRLIQRAGSSNDEHSAALLAQAGQTGPAGIFLSEDGNVLILGEVFKRCLAAHGETLEREKRFEWVHPDCERNPTEKNLSFLAATLAYRIASGVSPFMNSTLWSIRDSSGETESSFIARLIRGGYVLPLSTIKSGCNRQFSETIEQTLKGEHPDGLSAILDFGDSLGAIVTSNSSEEPKTVTADEESSIQRMKTRLKRTVFIRKHSTKFALAGIVAAFIALFGSMYVSDLQDNPTTAGMEQHEVVNGFYEAVANLDTNTLTSYATIRSSKEYIKLVSGIFMTNSILGRDKLSGGFSDPQQLFRDKLDGSHIIYGISRFELEEVASEDDRSEFLVSYYLFLPEETREMTNPDMPRPAEQPLTVYRYRDRCTLKRKKDCWRITKIEKLERSIAENSGSVVFKAIAAGKGDSLPYAPRAN